MDENEKYLASSYTEYHSVDSSFTIVLDKKIDDITTAKLWSKFKYIFENNKIQSILIDASQVEICTNAGIVLLYHYKENAILHGKSFEIINLDPKFSHLLSNFENMNLHLPSKQTPEDMGRVEVIGKTISENLEQIEKTIEFTGEVSISFLKFIKNPLKNIRWTEVLLSVEKSGADALFLVALIGFLFGLIMSFQSAIPMQRFGAEIFVANLVSLSLFRELGPLLTSIILAARSGSAFAAEIGTMKVSEELDALYTMGLNPIPYLVLPRLIAIMIVSPILTIFLNFFGLIGSSIVLISFGYPVVTFINQASRSVKMTDLIGGLFKSIIFGLLVAAIGCLSGIQTKEGASAVGESTTKSVVNGIVIISITDGIFALIYYILGI